MKRLCAAAFGLLVCVALSGVGCGFNGPTRAAKRYFAEVQRGGHPDFRPGSGNLEAIRAGIDFTRETINGDKACVEIRLNKRPGKMGGDHVAIGLRKEDGRWEAIRISMNGNCDWYLSNNSYVDQQTSGRRWQNETLAYEDTIEQKRTRSTAEMNDLNAKVRDLTQKILRDEAELDSESDNAEKKKIAESLIRSLESALKLIKRTIQIAENDQRDGLWPEANSNDLLAASRYAEQALQSKLADVKKQRAAL